MYSRRFLIKLQCLKKQRLEGVRFSLPQLFENYFVVTADLQTVFSCFCLSPEGRSVAVARWQTYRLRCHTSTALLKDRERLPFSRVPLWRINDLLLRLLALLILLGGGGSLTSILIFTPSLHNVLTHREMCHGAAVCCTAVTQFRHFFTTTTSAGNKKTQTRRHGSRCTLLQKLKPAPLHIRQPRSPRRAIWCTHCVGVDFITAHFVMSELKATFQLLSANLRRK